MLIDILKWSFAENEEILSDIVNDLNVQINSVLNEINIEYENKNYHCSQSELKYQNLDLKINHQHLICKTTPENKYRNIEIKNPQKLHIILNDKNRIKLYNL